jgi:hypothetical protein
VITQEQEQAAPSRAPRAGPGRDEAEAAKRRYERRRPIIGQEREDLRERRNALTRDRAAAVLYGQNIAAVRERKEELVRLEHVAAEALDRARAAAGDLAGLRSERSELAARLDALKKYVDDRGNPDDLDEQYLAAVSERAEIGARLGAADRRERAFTTAEDLLLRASDQRIREGQVLDGELGFLLSSRHAKSGLVERLDGEIEAIGARIAEIEQEDKTFGDRQHDEYLAQTGACWK